MADHDVDLTALLQDLEPVALKRLASAPLGLKAGRLARLSRDQQPVLGEVTAGEMVSVLLHRARLDDQSMGQAVIDYRNAFAWEVQLALEGQSPQQGTWTIDVPGRGQHG